MIRNGKSPRSVLASVALAVVFAVAPSFTRAAESPPGGAAVNPPIDNPPARPGSPEDIESVVPKAPSAPPKLLAPKRKEGFNCDRYFTYKGRVVTCDSDVKHDAENLRTVVRDVPAAVAELDRYDANRESIKSAAYIGTAGIALGIIGVLLSPHFKSSTNPNEPALIRSISIIGGLGISAGAFIYASGVVRSNEAHIGNAVNDFNIVHPESPIELQFSTGITF